MFIKYLDYLSPKITFYSKGHLSHSSIISGITSIIANIFIIFLAVYFFLDVIHRKNPNTSFFHSFVDDAGTYELNSSSLFHFINVIQRNNLGEIKEGFDFSRFNIIGFKNYITAYLYKLKVKNLNTMEHWLYGYCDKAINTEGLDDLITYELFNESACIKYYYNKEEKQYYKVGDPSFIWPEIAYGTFNDKNEIYGLYIQKCKENLTNYTLGEGYRCQSTDNYFTNLRVIQLNFVNNYINAINYKNPNKKFLYRIENPFEKNHYSMNDININPTLVRSHDGFLFDNIKDDVSYTFDRNDVYINSNEGEDIFVGYCFFLKNIMQYYERTYKRIQDIISNIGGLFQVIYFIAFYLNKFYNNYIILSDTEQLLFSLIDLEKEIQKKKYFENKNIKYIDDKNKNSESNNYYEIKKNSESYQSSSIKNISGNQKKNKEDIFNSSKIENSAIKCNNYFTNLEENKENNDLNFNIIKKNNKKDKAIKKENENSNNLNFWTYFFYKFTFRKNNVFFNVYENFRIKIMSEDHLIRNHLNLYNLLEVSDKTLYLRIDNYQIKDLIKAL